MMNFIKPKIVLSILSLATMANLILYSGYHFKQIIWAKKLIESDSEYEPLMEFDDSNFRPLLQIYKFGPKYKTKEYFRFSRIPTMLIMSSLPLGSSFWKVQGNHVNNFLCPLPCRFTDIISEVKNVDAIGFYEQDVCNVVNLSVKLLKKNRDLSQPWVLFALEPPTRAYPMFFKCKKSFDGVFNRTLSYRRDSDVKAYHGFIVSRKEVKFLPSEWVVPTSNMTSSRRKLAAVFLSRCETPSGRSEYVREMQKHTNQVQVYGDCGNKKCASRRSNDVDYKISSDKCYKMISRKYMFYLSFENSICNDYATEKIYNVMFYHLVPIVLGGAQYASLLPPHSYINAADYSPKELVNYLLYLQENPAKYEQYFDWKKYFKPSTIESERSLCDLCVQMHNPNFYKPKIYTNFTKWFVDEANCNQAWTRDKGIHQVDISKFYNALQGEKINAANQFINFVKGNYIEKIRSILYLQH